MNYKKLKELQSRYDEELKRLSQKLEALPPGSLNVTQNGKYQKWIRYIHGQQFTIPKKDRPLAENLAYKKYICLRMNELKQKINAIESYVQHSSKMESSEDLLMNPKFKDLLHAHIFSTSDRINDWLNMPFEQNRNYPEHLKHKSISGNVLRSKSELLIDMTLFKHQIPFRYECALTLNDSIIYPDFTIIHPETLVELYWEHFGLMDNPAYARKAFDKLLLYTQNGILPDIQLIMTFENSNHPLTLDVIENKIAQFLSL